MDSPRLLDRRVLRLPVLVTLVLAVPPVVIIRFVKGGDLAGRESNLWVLAIGLLLIGYLVGGLVAAARSPRLALSHAAGTAVYAFIVMAVGSVIVALSLRSRIDTGFVLSLLMVGLLCVCVAVLGGYMAVRWKEWRSDRRRTAEGQAA